MKKQPSPRDKRSRAAPPLFAAPAARRRRALILPRYLAEAAPDKRLLGSRFDRAFEILTRWADLESKGHLARKETALDAEFLHEVFGEALGYQTHAQNPERYHLERNFTVPRWAPPTARWATSAPPGPLRRWPSLS